jgi:pyridoxal/pyridoxine/pyridoxamine kinase
VNLTSAGATASVDVVVNWVNKTTTRLAEAVWVTFDPVVQDPDSGL